MSEILLKATALEKRYGGLKAVSGVSIDVHRDEVHAVIGPNGAGKSTLINLLSGDTPVTSGAVLLRDRDITTLSPDRRAMAGVGRSYQKTTIFAGSTVFENVRLAAQAHGGQPLRLIGDASGIIREEGIATIVVDKDHRSLAKVADRMVIMAKGEIAFDGTPAALAADRSILEKHLGV